MSLADVGLTAGRVQSWIKRRDNLYLTEGRVGFSGELLTKGIVAAAFCMDDGERAALLCAPAVVRRPRWALRYRAGTVASLLAAGIRPAHVARVMGVSTQAIYLRRAHHPETTQQRPKRA